MSASPDPIVCFGAFQLDRRTGELRKAGVRISLPEQPFQVLKALLDHPSELVTREELRQRLWPADTFVDFEHGLNAAVRRLRDALGDSPNVPRFIETLPRRGYRFIAPMAGPSAADQPTAPTVEPAGPTEEIADGGRTSQPPDAATLPAQTRIRRRLLVAASLLVAAFILWASADLLRRLTTTSLLSTPLSTTRYMLAVLPFENMTGDPGQEYVSDGMTEELIVQLGRMDPARLGVIARTSAMQFKETAKRADQIGAELGVNYLLEGSVRASGSRIRIAVQLINAQSESQLWSDQYERDAKDLLTLQREVAEAITRQITTSLGVAPSNVDAEARRHATNAETYDHYLRGRYHWQQDSAAGFAKGKEHFRKAIELDPSYAPAYSGLADIYTMQGSVGFLPTREAYPLARTAALKAIELDDRLAEAHSSLGSVSADYDWDWEAADRHFKRAVELNPNYEAAVRFYSSYLSNMGRHDEALLWARRARDLNPVSPNAWWNLGLVHYFARRYDDAITQFRETLDLDPAFGLAHVMLGRTYVAMGLPDRAVEELERAKGLMGLRPDVITPYAYVLAKAGRRREALAALDELRRISKPRDPSPFRVAYVHIGLGETERAFEELPKAVEARDWQMSMLKVEPTFDVLRSDPRFAALLRQVGFAQ